MHPNRKLSQVCFAIEGMNSFEIGALVSSLDDDSEAKDAIKSLAQIKHVGETTALEILLSVIRFVEENGQE